MRIKRKAEMCVNGSGCVINCKCWLSLQTHLGLTQVQSMRYRKSVVVVWPIVWCYFSHTTILLFVSITRCDEKLHPLRGECIVLLVASRVDIIPSLPFWEGGFGRPFSAILLAKYHPFDDKLYSLMIGSFSFLWATAHVQKSHRLAIKNRKLYKGKCFQPNWLSDVGITA